MARSPVVVLYEDQGTAAKGFGFHDLVLACVRDRSSAGLDPRSYFDGRPQKGNGNVLRNCRGPLANQHRYVVAVFDSDKIRALLGIGLSASDEAVRKAVLNGAQAPHKVRVHLLERNLESVIREVPGCNGGERLVEEALQKDRSARDLVLRRAAADRAIRDCLQKKNSSLARLVSDLVTLLPAP
jgi:hypothetical protein